MLKRGWLAVLIATTTSVAGVVQINACASYGSETNAPIDASIDGRESGNDPTDAAVDVDEKDSSTTLTWTPADLPGLALWLDATHVETATGSTAVLRWIDRSGQGNDARPFDAGAPRLLAASSGGKPAVEFSGVDGDYLVIPDNNAGLRFGTGPFLIEVVGKHLTPLNGRLWNYGFIYSKQSPTSPFPGVALSANHAPDNDHGTAVSALQGQVDGADGGLISEEGYRGQPFLLGFQRSTLGMPTIDLRIGGAVVRSMQTTPADRDVSAAGAPSRIGGSPQGQNLVGEISEVVVVGGEVTPQELTKLEAYFKAKYSL